MSEQDKPFSLFAHLQEQVWKKKDATNSREVSEEIEEQTALGEEVQQLRKKLGVDRATLAAALGIEREELFAIEQGAVEDDERVRTVITMIKNLIDGSRGA